MNFNETRNLKGLFLLLAFGSFLGLQGMEAEKGQESASDEEVSEETRELQDKFLEQMAIGNTDTVAEMLARGGIDPNFVDPYDEDGNTPLFAAVSYLKPEMIRLLLANGANPTIKNAKGYPLIFKAIDENKSTMDNSELLRVLVENDKNTLNASGPGGQTPFQYAIAHGDTDLAKILLGLGADINGQDNQGRTALHHAAELGLSRVVDFLLEHGADTTIRDIADATADQVALRDPGIARDIIEHRASPIQQAQGSVRGFLSRWFY